MTTRGQLESRLRASKARLVARQGLRSAFSGLAGAACGLGLGVVFLELLPRLLFATSLGIAPALAAGAAGCAAALVADLRRYRMPSLQETALALEARLTQDTGALAAALRVDETDPFYAPLLVRAEADLTAAEHAPAPVLIRTRKLVLVPLMALASGVAFAAVVAAEPPVQANAAVTARGGNESKWRSVDVGGGRTEVEAAALREALGMKEQAAALNRSAATLREAESTQSERNQALQDAKSALEGADGKAAVIAPTDLPETAPTDANDRGRLADALEAAASGLTAAAENVAKGNAGSEDTGNEGDFNAVDASGRLVPFAPALVTQDARQNATATQTPARRQLAQRAVAELEKLQR